jgi:hypothetical protein
MLRVTSNRLPRAWHSDPDCHHLDGVPESGVRETDPEEAERMGLDECKSCAEGAGGDRNNGTECPYCGETVGLLPDHLPCDAV